MLPSIHGWISSSFGLFASSSLLEQKNTAFSQQFATARMGYMAPIPKLKKVFAHIALGGVLQRTLISEKNETLSRLDQWSHAAGLGVGTHWSPKVGQSFVWRLGWDALFVPPGESSIYLTFGHTQSVYCGFGWSL